MPIPKSQRVRSRHESPSSTAAAAEQLPDVLKFMRLLWQVVHQLEKRSKQMAASLGVTGPQRLVLRLVGLLPGASAGTLAEILHIHPSTLTGVLQRLVRQGLLRRSSETRDRRRAVLSLTPRGKRINAITKGTVESAIAMSLARIGTRDTAATERALGVIAEHLDGSAAASTRAPAAGGRTRARS